MAAIGAGLAFAANAISPNGIKLSRNYFPGDRTVVSNAIPAAVGSNDVSQAEALSARLRQKGLTLIGSREAAELFHDPRMQQNLVVFVDARDDAHYAAGHIPGAHQLDYYRAENYLAAVLPAAQVAQRIVVYCNGGDCEDSELAAVMLRDSGVPADRLLVYGGGMAQWKAEGLPVEIGARGSGRLLEADSGREGAK